MTKLGIKMPILVIKHKSNLPKKPFPFRKDGKGSGCETLHRMSIPSKITLN